MTWSRRVERRLAATVQRGYVDGLAEAIKLTIGNMRRQHAAEISELKQQVEQLRAELAVREAD